jgi:hypothetical protein
LNCFDQYTLQDLANFDIENKGQIVPSQGDIPMAGNTTTNQSGNMQSTMSQQEPNEEQGKGEEAQGIETSTGENGGTGPPTTSGVMMRRPPGNTGDTQTVLVSGALT